MDWQHEIRDHHNMEDLMYHYQDIDDQGDYVDDYYDDDYEFDHYGQYYEDEYSKSVTFSQLLDHCIIPTLSQTIYPLYPLLGLCIVSRITCYVTAEVLHGARGLMKPICHSCSAVCGLVTLHMFFQENMVYLVMLGILSFLLLHVINCRCQGWNGIAVSFITLVYLLTCELKVVQQVEWHKIRGSQMVLAMKVISIAIDLDNNNIQSMPDIWSFFGYLFQVGTVIFGPWISYSEYTTMLNYRERKIDFYWFMKISKSLILSMVCLMISTCILLHWLSIDDSLLWLAAYRDAQSFRFSHYFISYLAELTLTLSGLGLSKINGEMYWDASVSKLYHVELPRSLVEVVMYWDLPMHYWLKTYVFKPTRSLGILPAILLTYAASATLHGLNFQLAAVLLSLGVYSYIENVLRNYLSKVLSACIQAKRCKHECVHQFKSSHPYTIVLNIVFGLITVFHLAYLGLMFDNSADEEQGYTMDHTLSKWASLGYASHWFILITYIFYLLI